MCALISFLKVSAVEKNTPNVSQQVSIPKGKYSIRLMDAYHINRCSLPDSRIKLSAVDSELCGLSRVSGTLS